MRKYILRAADGSRIEEPATGLVAAMRQVTGRGIKIRNYAQKPHDCRATKQVENGGATL